MGLGWGWVGVGFGLGWGWEGEGLGGWVWRGVVGGGCVWGLGGRGKELGVARVSMGVSCDASCCLRRIRQRSALRKQSRYVCSTSKTSVVLTCIVISSIVGFLRSRNLRVSASGAGTPTSLEMRATHLHDTAWRVTRGHTSVGGGASTNGKKTMGENAPPDLLIYKTHHRV